MRPSRFGLAVGLLVAACAGTPAQAQPTPPGATISLESTTVRLDQRVVVTLAGWTSRNVTLAVCGNLARRGTSDCNMVLSQAAKLVSAPAPDRAELLIASPPATCPCVIRGSSSTQNEVAFLPIDIVDVPVGPVIGAEFGSLIAVSLDVRAAPRGLVASIRSALAGPAAYTATVTVRNLTAEKLGDISIAGSAGRGSSDQNVHFDLPSPGELAPGQTWTHDTALQLPAPVFKRFTWRVVASGAGPTVDDEIVTRRIPLGFIILAAVLAGDCVAMARYFSRRRAGRRREQLASTPARDAPLEAVPS